jgi:hypothetical protein
MPWWAWLLIWAVLLLSLLGMLALFAVLLFRKAGAVARELEHLASLATILDQADQVLDDQRADIAILENYAEVRRRRERVRFEAMTRRSARHSARIARAKSLIAVEADKRSWFVTAGPPKER